MIASHPRLLVVEDNARVRADLLDAFRAEGYEPEVAVTYAMAKVALERHHDLVVMSLDVPGGDGLGICRELRAAGRSVPILAMAQATDACGVVEAMDAGADDFVGKPIDLPEVLARVRGLLRRTGKSPAGGFLKHLDLWVDMDKVAAGREDTVFKLKPREFDLLKFLVRNPGKAWSRAQLLDHVWGHDFTGDERTVDLHVRRLREKIKAHGSEVNYIETVWRVGYAMVMQLPERSER